MKTLLVVVALSTLAGCTTYYTKPGAVSGEFERDKHICKQQAQRIHSRGVWGTKTQTNWDLYKQCMAARGWRKTRR